MNQLIVFKWFYKAAEIILPYFPDWITGNSHIMQQKYLKKYGTKDNSLLIKQNKIHILAVYMMISITFILIGLGIVVEQLLENKEITSIKRPAYGETEEAVPIEVQMKYKDYELSKNITIKVKEKDLTLLEKREFLQNYKDQLGKIILGENKDLSHVNKPLNLVDRDQGNGITIIWTSDHSEVINEQGELDLLNAKENQEVGLKAYLTLDDVTITENFELVIDAYASEEDYKQSLEGRLKDMIKLLSETGNSAKMNLPHELEDEIELRWFAGNRNNGVLFILIFLIAILTVYFKRYDRLNKEIKNAEESIARDLPEFINKLVLLLNAGLVVSSAFSKIVEDYDAFYQRESLDKNKRKKRCLYEELSGIQKRVNQSNTSLIKELKEFSQRSGVREMVRLTAVISDNWSKGSALAEKLEGESELLWISRKKRAEEKGRLAETKLTFPLMILLIVLIMVTIAPALMEM